MGKTLKIPFEQFDFSGMRKIEAAKSKHKTLKEPKYFYVWVEGIEPKGGEKIKHFNQDGSIEYTLNMLEAMRVRKKDVGAVKIAMRQAGVANWVLEGKTFIGTSYAPKGTIWNTESYKNAIQCNKK